MTNEEMQKAMEFIVNQQAQFAADIQKLQEAQAQLQQSQAQMQEAQAQMQESQAQTVQLLNRLAAVTVKGFEDTNAKINALVDAQTRTEESVRSLTSIVDRHFREGRNGGNGN